MLQTVAREGERERGKRLKKENNRKERMFLNKARRYEKKVRKEKYIALREEKVR